MFSDPENPTQGFSAVRGLELAAAEGQRVFQIDQGNVNQAMSQLNLDFEVEVEIRDSIRAGFMVITHMDNVSVPGFSGAGYLILDPDTLIGAYKISGGGNGGFIDAFEFPDLALDDIALFLTAAALGFVDSSAGQTLSNAGRTLFSPSYIRYLEEVVGNSGVIGFFALTITCLLYTSPSPRDLSTSRMPSSA